MTKLTEGTFYGANEVAGLLQLPTNVSRDFGPAPGDGEVVIYYGGWGLKQLRSCCARRFRLPAKYEEQNWNAEPGYYRLLLPMPRSAGKTLNRQIGEVRKLNGRWQPAPVALAATALLVHLATIQSNQICLYRCAESCPNKHHVMLVASGTFLYLMTTWDGIDSDCLWLAAAQKC